MTGEAERERGGETGGGTLTALTLPLWQHSLEESFSFAALTNDDDEEKLQQRVRERGEWQVVKREYMTRMRMRTKCAQSALAVVVAVVATAFSATECIEPSRRHLPQVAVKSSAGRHTQHRHCSCP